MQKQPVIFVDMGVIGYKDAWDKQEQLMQENLKSRATVSNLQPADNTATTNYQPQTTNYLLFVEHPPVYTLGKSGKIEHVLIDDKKREEAGITERQTSRPLESRTTACAPKAS